MRWFKSIDLGKKQFQKAALALWWILSCHHRGSRATTLLGSSVLSAVRQCKKEVHMVHFRNPRSKQNKMDSKVTLERTSKRSQVHNAKSTVCVSWHLLLCQGPLLWSLSSSFEGAREGSLLLQSLSFIFAPSHHPLGEDEGNSRRNRALAFYTSISSLVLLLLPFPLAFFRGSASPCCHKNFLFQLAIYVVPKL